MCRFYYRFARTLKRVVSTIKPSIVHRWAMATVMLGVSYGVQGKYADVTAIVQRFAREGIRFQVSNQTFGIDPNHGVHKHLRVIMMGLDGTHFEISEGESIRL